MDVNRPVSYDLADYLGMLRRHWWLVLLLSVAGVAGGATVAHAQPKVYEAATSVLVSPTGVPGANAAGGRTTGTINLDTEAQLVVSTDIAIAAQKLLKVNTPPDQLAANVTVTVPPNTTVLTVTYAAGSPKEAQSGSHAFAMAYLQNRQASAQADLTTQTSALDAKVKQYSATLSQLSGRLATMRTGDPNKADLNSQIATLTAQINTLTSRENDLSTTQVTAGKIINDAEAPTAPARPSVPLFLASGAMVGLLLGLGTGLVRERTDKRVRRAADVTRRAAVPVLGVLRGRLEPRIFDRLRNELLASLGADDRVLVVTGASPGHAAGLLAANLAAALARAGSAVVLVRTDAPSPAGPPDETVRVLEAAGTPLHVVREKLARLRAGGGYVVVEAPSAAASADAQSLASHADAAILAVELRRTRHAEIVDAAEQLHRVGTRLLGAVVFPRLGKLVPAKPAPAAVDDTVVLGSVS